MEYRAVGSRCAVNINALQLPTSPRDTIDILGAKGFRLVEVDILALARECVGKSEYRRAARSFRAPQIVDCSSLMKWLYGQRGIWLPRRSIQQLALGEGILSGEIAAGDLVFVSGWKNYYVDDPAYGVGHVGIATGEGTVIHAANRRAGIVEGPFEKFANESKLRGIRRYIPKSVQVLTFEIPKDRDVETEDDLRWIVLQSL